MENEYDFSQFDIIEKKIVKLIEARQFLELEKTELTEKINHLERALQQKEEAEKQHEEEKRVVRSRIELILSKLDELEER